MGRNYRVLATLLLGTFSALVSVAGPAWADETGLASLHSWQRVGTKVCFVDHSHDGSGNGHDQPTAMREAVRSWESFTDLEYGSDWAAFGNSVGKSFSCNRNLSDISCRVTATPCKSGVLSSRPTKSSRRRVAH